MIIHEPVRYAILQLICYLVRYMSKHMNLHYAVHYMLAYMFDSSVWTRLYIHLEVVGGGHGHRETEHKYFLTRSGMAWVILTKLAFSNDLDLDTFIGNFKFFFITFVLKSPRAGPTYSLAHIRQRFPVGVPILFYLQLFFGNFLCQGIGYCHLSSLIYLPLFFFPSLGYQNVA